MARSRLSRFEEKNAQHRIAIGVLGSLGVLVFIAFFGVKLLIGFSVFVDRIRGNSPASLQQQSILIPPSLNSLPEATGSATITVSGTAAPKSTVVMYLNNVEYKRLTVKDDGTFEIPDISVNEGTVTASAKLIDAKQTLSDSSNIITTIIDRTPPALTVDAPEDTATVNDGTHKVTVKGKTDEDMKVTINGRIVVLKTDGSFSYAMPLSDGDNTLDIVSTDLAGNSTKVTRHVTYQP